MVAQVSKDDGKGGRSDANNREYGGVLTSAGIDCCEGPVGSPKLDGAHSYLADDVSTFHDHPSGSLIENGSKFKYVQQPSQADLNNAGSHTWYVFGRRDGTVYIYNRDGVQATMPIKYFINPKRK